MAMGAQVLVDADLDTLATALHTRTDDPPNAVPEHAPEQH
jgi:hypothetical protein